MDVRMQASSSTPRLPSISSVGPTQTTLTHDVTEPPEISIQLPEVHKLVKSGGIYYCLLYKCFCDILNDFNLYMYIIHVQELVRSMLQYALTRLVIQSLITLCLCMLTFMHVLSVSLY